MYFWDKHKTITGYYELLSGEVCDRYGLTQMEYICCFFLYRTGFCFGISRSYLYQKLFAVPYIG